MLQKPLEINATSCLHSTVLKIHFDLNAERISWKKKAFLFTARYMAFNNKYFYICSDNILKQEQWFSSGPLLFHLKYTRESASYYFSSATWDIFPGTAEWLSNMTYITLVCNQCLLDVSNLKGNVAQVKYRTYVYYMDTNSVLIHRHIS